MQGCFRSYYKNLGVSRSVTKVNEEVTKVFELYDDDKK